MDEGAGKTVLSAMLAVVGGTGNVDVAVFNGYGEVGVDGFLEFAFGTFYGYYVAGNGYSNACGQCNGSFSYT